MTGLHVATKDLTVRFGDTVALDGLSVELAPGRIHGLLGRNGSGKSTLVGTFAGFLRQTGGTVEVGGLSPFENLGVTSQVCLIRESGDLVGSCSVRGAVAMARDFRPYWSDEVAGDLLDRFEIPAGKRVQSLSRGKKSALGVVLGLASRAPLTIFDETYLGMDVPSRNLFYDALIEEYATHPRTVVMSTHLVGEVSSLLEDVLIIDRGRMVIQSPAEDLRGRGASVVGPIRAVEEFTAGLTVLSEQTLAGTRSTTVYGILDAIRRRQAAEAGLELGPVGLQDLFVHLTAPTQDAEKGAVR